MPLSPLMRFGFGDYSRGHKGLWAVTAVMVIWGVVAAFQGKAGPPPELGAHKEGDLRMYQAITARVAGGTPYHAAVAIEMPARGYAIRPVFNWRLPTLAWLNALPPSPRWGQAALWALGLLVIGLWTVVLGVQIPRVTVANAIVMGLATVAILQVKDAIYLHEVWAGLLIAASLAIRALRRTGLAVAFGLLALLIRELALPYVLAMAMLALIESRRREAAAWASTVVVFLAYWLWHLRHVLANMPAEGLHNDWLVAGGWPFVLTAARCSVFLMFLPAWLVAVFVPIAWAGFWRWSNATGRRFAISLTVYFAMFMLIGRPDNWYWGFLVAPLIPVGLFGHFFDRTRVRVEFS